MAAQPQDENPARACARVIESAIALTRAELTLVLFRGRAMAMRLAGMVAAGCVAVTLSQVAIVLLALSPVLAGFRPWRAVLLGISPVVVLAAVAWLMAWRFWRAAMLFAKDGDKQEQTPTTNNVPTAFVTSERWTHGAER